MLEYVCIISVHPCRYVHTGVYVYELKSPLIIVANVGINATPKEQL